MKKNYLLFLSMLCAFYCSGQQLLVIEPYQKTELSLTASNNIIKLPTKMAFPVVSGLDQWDGLENSIHVFGSRLVIERSEIGLDGITKLTLRREDGLLFFDLFPRLEAQLVPTNTIPLTKRPS